MEQIIITSESASGLNTKIAKKIEEGFVPVGSHQVVTDSIQNTIRADSVVIRSQYRNVYSQTIKKG